MSRISKFMKMLMVIVLMTLVLIFILIMLILETTRRNKYDEQIILGDKYLAEQDYEQAELCFKRAIDISDKAAEPYVKLSNVYRETGNLEEAVSIVQAGTDNSSELTDQQRKILEDYASQLEQPEIKKPEKEDPTKKSPKDKDKIVGEVGISKDPTPSPPDPTTSPMPHSTTRPTPTPTPTQTPSSDSVGENTGDSNDQDYYDPNNDVQTDLRKIVEDVTKLHYIGDRGYGITASASGDQILCNSIGETGYLAAVQKDYDGDKAMEILVIALQNEVISAVKQDAFTMYMLKQNNTSWQIQDSYVIGEEGLAEVDKLCTVLRSGVFPARVQFFVNTIDGRTDIFMEMSAKKSAISPISPYSMQRFTYSSGEFSYAEIGFWADNLKDAGNPPEDTAASGTVTREELLKNINPWGLRADNLGYGNEVMGQNASMTPLVRVDKVSLMSETSLGFWDRTSPLQNAGRMVFTDYSSTYREVKAVPGTIDLLSIPIGISPEEFGATWKPLLEGAGAIQNEEGVYTLSKEASYLDVPLKVEFIFRNDRLVCIQFMNILSDTESHDKKLDAGDGSFRDKCIRQFAGQPEVFSFEGGMDSWDNKSERVDLIRRPGIIDFSRWDSAMGSEFALTLDQ